MAKSKNFLKVAGLTVALAIGANTAVGATTKNKYEIIQELFSKGKDFRVEKVEEAKQTYNIEVESEATIKKFSNIRHLGNFNYGMNNSLICFDTNPDNKVGEGDHCFDSYTANDPSYESRGIYNSGRHSGKPKLKSLTGATFDISKSEGGEPIVHNVIKKKDSENKNLRDIILEDFPDIFNKDGKISVKKINSMGLYDFNLQTCGENIPISTNNTSVQIGNSAYGTQPSQWKNKLFDIGDCSKSLKELPDDLDVSSDSLPITVKYDRKGGFKACDIDLSGKMVDDGKQVKIGDQLYNVEREPLRGYFKSSPNCENSEKDSKFYEISDTRKLDLADGKSKPYHIFMDKDNNLFSANWDDEKKCYTGNLRLMKNGIQTKNVKLVGDGKLTGLDLECEGTPPLPLGKSNISLDGFVSNGWAHYGWNTGAGITLGVGGENNNLWQFDLSAEGILGDHIASTSGKISVNPGDWTIALGMTDYNDSDFNQKTSEQSLGIGYKNLMFQFSKNQFTSDSPETEREVIEGDWVHDGLGFYHKIDTIYSSEEKITNNEGWYFKGGFQDPNWGISAGIGMRTIDWSFKDGITEETRYKLNDEIEKDENGNDRVDTKTFLGKNEDEDATITTFGLEGYLNLEPFTGAPLNTKGGIYTNMSDNQNIKESFNEGKLSIEYRF